MWLVSYRSLLTTFKENRAWRINRINKINSINRINNRLMNPCKLGLGLIPINNRLIQINDGLIPINDRLIRINMD